MVENNKVTIQYKINELITELNDCREDERNTQNQILEVISVSGTILGILFGASFLSTSNKDINLALVEELQLKHFCWINKMIRNITPARIVFWLSVLVFCVAFFYITYLGMTNVLRYHYIQNIEDRLYDLFPITSDNTDRGNFLHWNAFSAPILTKNKNHITSSHSALSFCTYVGAIICAILFSMGLVMALFFCFESNKMV